MLCSDYSLALRLFRKAITENEVETVLGLFFCFDTITRQGKYTCECRLRAASGILGTLMAVLGGRRSRKHSVLGSRMPTMFPCSI